MDLKFETLGNATLQLFENNAPVLATDPWLKGTAYFGSWGLDHPLAESQIRNVIDSPYIWISHGHPDHLHPESVEMLSRQSLILLPDHYDPEIKESFRSKGFRVWVLRFKQWTRLTRNVRVMCLENMNQDAILIIEAGDALIINLNDSPLHGEEPFLKKLIRSYKKTFLLSLCSIDADMFNRVDDRGMSLTPPLYESKRSAIWALGDLCTSLQVRNFCCFSSQHLYVRADSVWANPYRITWDDMKHHWQAPVTRLIEPFVTVDLANGSVTPNHPTHQPDQSAISKTTGEDDWNEKMSKEDWQGLEHFIRRFHLLRPHLDFIRFTVAGEARTFYLNDPRRTGAGGPRGIHFIAPRNSLMKTVEYGYFDDLLIANFMKTELIGVDLYPHFTPIVAKLGGNAKVFTSRQLWRFQAHYFRLSPRAYVAHQLNLRWFYEWKPMLRSALQEVGLLDAAKRTMRRALGLPSLPGKAIVNRDEG
ncbi:MAG: MBL fold metallo-hydrolase [Nitrospirae bacterium]|nr:MBL fold metallo-hydrolase [Candidatus Manganitrophaceae bacterium]